MPDPNFAAIQALATANLFRDASGLSNVVGLAQDLGKSTSTASSAGAAAALKATESALAPPPAPAKTGDTPKPGDASKPGESAKPPGGDASAAPASQPDQALKALEAGQAKLDNAVKLSSLPTNVSIAGAIINASLSLEAVAMAAQGGTPTPTTRERSGAVSEPRPAAREPKPTDPPKS
ncbi:hypothetical protein [Leptolyngbya sp. O-77]|uniref:hypothetical protein n=1 Tax=Leptolyngbya sp. O-77 TaxID=1080068 RepID=UPI00074D31B1|nr:hypothetical protein [Leptolyngbya sp. O-77]BAU41474.1 hypothetical protein O77CONTIG1_01284 [Leptolyngbya sp. O-77]